MERQGISMGDIATEHKSNHFSRGIDLYSLEISGNSGSSRTLQLETGKFYGGLQSSLQLVTLSYNYLPSNCHLPPKAT